MSSNRVVSVRGSDRDSVAAQGLRAGVQALQVELGVSPEFPADVLAEAEAAAAAPRLPELDRTDLEFLTIDPASSMDLDQALHLERTDTGFVVHYAIADLAAFVTPEGPLDLEVRRRGETLYGADSKIPLHPPVISEAAGSLLPDQVRPALLWTITLDATGEGTDVVVERARVRSRRRLSYDEAQAMLDDGVADQQLLLLKEIGLLRQAREVARGGVSLPLPEQEIAIEGDAWRLEFRQLLPVEDWNAQISLLTGQAAASLMMYARVGLLRTLPPADPRDVKRLHRTARALGIDWPAELTYPEFVRSLDPSQPKHAAMVVACTRLLRGSGYVGFNGELPAQAEHSAIAAEYAHVTAPLRRLVDRYASEICVAICADTPVPQWVLDRLGDVPEAMRESGRLANRYENGILNLVEAHMLHDRVGERFTAVITEVSDKDETKGELTLADPAVEARVSSDRPLPVGERIEVTLSEADPIKRSVQFTL